MASHPRSAVYERCCALKRMDYQALGLGEAASVVTAVTISQDAQTISIICLYDPQKAHMPYTLSFQHCAHIAWDTFDNALDLQQLDAELIGLSLCTDGPRQCAVITTDMFELSFFYESFAVQTPASIVHAVSPNH